jgi:hypothetical protein
MGSIKLLDIRTDELAESKALQRERIDRIRRVLRQLSNPSTQTERDIRVDKLQELQIEEEQFDKINQQLNDANSADRQLLATLAEQV